LALPSKPATLFLSKRCVRLSLKDFNYDRLSKIGFEGSHEIVKRSVIKALKDTRRQIAYIRFETEPGRQAQVDLGEFQVALPDGSIQKTYLFSMILGYSRKIFAAFIERCDLPTFLDCPL